MPINIKDGDSIRKLSKRKDKEALVEYFAEKGYPNKAILCYLLRLMCPSFDDYFAEIIDTKDRNSPLNLKAKDPHF
ncbi:MAG: hypothetical protein ORN26_01660 [Candidatus Pacebacteria bacterium]|nr:hypothetical protein [Candidatus Paceibacterota bacterium]